jgi:hypothetical protein
MAASVAVDAPADYFEGFASRVRDRIRKPPRRSLIMPVWALTAAAVLLVAVTAPSLLRRQLDVGPAAALRPAPAPPTTAIPDRPAPEAQDSVGALGYVEGERKRDDAQGGRAASSKASPKKTRSKDEAKAEPPFALAAPTPSAALPQAPPPAATAPPVAAAVPQSRSEETPERAADSMAFEQAAPQPADRDVAAERRQRGEESHASERTTGFARAPSEADRPASEAPQAQASQPTLQKTAPSAAFRALLERRAVTIAEARGLREAWRAFVQGASEGEADEARVRVIESGRDAYRLSGERVDLDLLRGDAAAYLKRADAHQAERVKALLRGLPR